MNEQMAARIHNLMSANADAQGATVRLSLSGAAYTSGRFESTYDAYAARLGHRPVFTVFKAPRDGMTVATTPADESAARAIIAELEAA